jgi:hypothetical protein
MRFTSFTRARGVGRGSIAVLSAGVLATTALVAGMASANAVVSPGGGRNADGTPAFVRDGQGLAMQLCVNATFCEAADAAAGDIGQYFSAEAALGPMRAIWGIDAAFLEDAAGNLTNRPGVTNAALFRAEGLRPNSRYTIRGPWGTHRCTTNADGALDNKNCLFEAGGEAGGALRTGPIKSLLFTARAPRGFLGDLVVPQRVTGSPSGFNRVTLTGPGANFSTNRFVLGGQMRANQPMGLLAKDSLRFGSRTNTRTVTRTLRYRSVGTAPATLRVRRAGPNPFAFKVRENCGALAPRQVCRIRVSYNPGANNRRARLVINDNTLAPPRRVSLTGIAPR